VNPGKAAVPGEAVEVRNDRPPRIGSTLYCVELPALHVTALALSGRGDIDLVAGLLVRPKRRPTEGFRIWL
jgi:hypothetical protein